MFFISDTFSGMTVRLNSVKQNKDVKNRIYSLFPFPYYINRKKKNISAQLRE